MHMWRYFQLLQQWYLLRIKGCIVRKRGRLLVIEGGKRATSRSSRSLVKQRLSRTKSLAEYSAS